MTSMRKKMLITGCNGLLGGNATIEASERYEVIASSRTLPQSAHRVEKVTFDITDEASTIETVRSLSPAIILHCAAETRVDYCEDHPEHAAKINTQGARNIARAAELVDALVVYISTDSVFDGESGFYTEPHEPAPVNIYSLTKLRGEEEVRRESRNHLIVRTNMFGWNMMPKESLAEWVINSLRSGKGILGFTDIVFAPLLANDLTGIVMDMVEEGLRGTFHVGARDHVSKYEFARKLCRIFDLDFSLVKPSLSDAMPFRALRPKQTNLDPSAVESLLGRQMPTVEEGLQHMRFLEDSGYVAKLRSVQRSRVVSIREGPDVLDWRNLNILVTGGTGSFGKKFTEIVLKQLRPRRLVIFSRDELKQHEMRQQFPDGNGSPVRYVIGDVRNKERLYRAFRDIDLVVHAAALKQVPACEDNPFEAVQTNILGAENIIDAAVDCGVKLVMALSTDKAVSPVNLYGATKLVAEKLFTQSNVYGTGRTRFSSVRYGNVVGSRGSIIPLLRQQRDTGKITVTDERMTRFWITLEQAVHFVLKCIESMHGGEIFVPKIPSMRIMDLAEAIAPGCQIEFTGIRPGEKLHEMLVNEDEARHTRELEDMFIIEPLHPWWAYNDLKGLPLHTGYRYASETNDQWLTCYQLQGLADEQAELTSGEEERPRLRA